MIVFKYLNCREFTAINQASNKLLVNLPAAGSIFKIQNAPGKICYAVFIIPVRPTLKIHDIPEILSGTFMTKNDEQSLYSCKIAGTDDCHQLADLEMLRPIFSNIGYFLKISIIISFFKKLVGGRKKAAAGDSAADFIEERINLKIMLRHRVRPCRS